MRARHRGVEKQQQARFDLIDTYLKEDTVMSDLNLRKNILEELEFQPEIDAANIGVTVEDGVVTLSGHVKSYA